MQQFLIDNMALIITAAVLVIVAVILFFVCKGKYRTQAKQILLSLVIAAEEKFGGGGTGEIKFSYVAERLYEIMPDSMKFFLTEASIANLIETAVTKMKEILSKNPESDFAKSLAE